MCEDRITSDTLIVRQLLLNIEDVLRTWDTGSQRNTGQCRLERAEWSASGITLNRKGKSVTRLQEVRKELLGSGIVRIWRLVTELGRNNVFTWHEIEGLLQSR